MVIPLIQANESNWLKIPEIVDEHFRNGELRSGFVLIQDCGQINFELKYILEILTIYFFTHN